MFKRIISQFLLLLFSLNGLFAVPAVAGHRIESQGGGTVTLDARGDEVPENATGTAKFDLTDTAEGVGRMTVTLTIQNLPKEAQRVYEVWLLNTDGTDLNLTSFNTNNDGDAKVTTERNIVNISPYDSIIVSSKRADSFETSRVDNVVLSGQLHRDNGDFDDDDEFDDNDDSGDNNGFNDDEFDDNNDSNNNDN